MRTKSIMASKVSLFMFLTDLQFSVLARIDRNLSHVQLQALGNQTIQ